MNHQRANTYSTVLIGILCLLSLQSFCQEYNTNIFNISVKSGLSQNTIMDVVQDDYGFLWVGTQDGLNKYDGYTFKVYKSDPQNPASIPNNFIKCVVKDEEGNLWIGTQTGLAKYFYKEDRFQEIASATHDPINTILIDKNTIFIGTSKGLYKANSLSNPEFNLIESTVSKDPILHLALDSFDRIWISKDTGLCMLSQESNELYDFTFLKETKVRTTAFLRGKCWIASDKGLFSFHPESAIIDENNSLEIADLTHYPIADEDYKAISIFEDHHNNIWVGTVTKGVFRISDEQSKLLASHFNSDQLKFSAINKVYEDYTHCLWVGTVEAGLFRINFSNKNFKLIRTADNNPNGLTSNIVRGLLKIDHRLWIGTARGLNLFNRNTGTNRKFVHDKDDPSSISSNDVKIMDYAEDGTVWVGTDNGLNRLDPGTGTFTRFFAEDPNPIITNNRIRSVKTLKDGTLWVGTLGGGISVINSRDKKKIKSYQTQNGGIGDDNVMNVFEAMSGDVYATTYGDGLFRLNKSKDVFEKVLPDSNLPDLLTTIHQSKDGMLWVGSYGDGFYELNPKSLQFRRFTPEDGLSNGVVYAAIPQDNAVWISTNYGLNKYDRKTNAFISFNENDGIQSNEFNTNSFYQCHTGELFFGGVNGLTYFYSDSIKYDSQKPRLAFTDLKIFNESVKPGQVVIDGQAPLKEVISDSSQVTLSYFHNSFSIEFASLAYSNPEDAKYAYQLAGFDEDWIYTDSKKREVTYTNLNPGEYTFMMKGSNGDGSWSNQPIHLFITIAPSIWQTVWFRISIALLGISILVLLVYNRINKVERRKKFLELKIKEHTKEISEQNERLTQSEQHLINENKKKDQVFYILSHNVRSPLTTLVALLKNSDQLSKQDFDSFVSDSSQQISESLLLLDNAFYWSLIQFDKLIIHQETFDLSLLIKKSIEKFEKTLVKNKVKIECDADKKPITTDKRMLSLILQNLLFNSIKFSQPETGIQVSLLQDDENLRIKMTYSGQGMSKEEINQLFDEVTDIHEIKSQNEKGVALGLIVSYKLANHLNYQLEIEKHQDHSILILEMPLQ